MPAVETKIDGKNKDLEDKIQPLIDDLCDTELPDTIEKIEQKIEDLEDKIQPLITPITNDWASKKSTLETNLDNIDTDIAAEIGDFDDTIQDDIDRLKDTDIPAIVTSVTEKSSALETKIQNRIDKVNDTDLPAIVSKIG